MLNVDALPLLYYSYPQSAVSQQFAVVCRELDIPYLDVFSTLVKSSVWLAEAKANDGAHPGMAGYTEFAAIVQNWDAWLSWFTP